MISYLGISIDDLLQAFEDSLVFSDDRPSRSLEEPIEVTEQLLDAEGEELEGSAAEDEAEEEDYEDDGIEEVFVDEEGRLHTIAPTVPEAAEAALDLLTDYLVADDIDPEWLTLDQARGAVLALRVLLPTFEEIPEVESAYSFKIERDPGTGYPSFMTMKPLAPDTVAQESLTFDEKAYEGQVAPSSSLLSMIEEAGVPADERELLFEVISEGIYTLDEQQCGIVIDFAHFCQRISEMAQAAGKGSAPAESSGTEAPR